MLFALSTSHKIGLATMGAIFIIYSLVSAFILPRRNPNFPGRYLVPYILLSIGMFALMMGAVLVFGKEPKVAEASAGTTTTQTSTTGTTTTSTPSTGDPAAGKVVFMNSGCSACHKFTAAGASGTVGPDLDNLAEYAMHANQPVEPFTSAAIEHPPAAYVPPGYPTNVMQPYGGVTMTPTQLSDLVAFLTTQ
jgi:mono/diheme cytochrome c family protein